MRVSSFSKTPPALGVLAVLVFLGALLGREASISEDLPVFFSQQADILHVELTGDDLIPGLYQFCDGLTPYDVIKLTTALSVDSFRADPEWSQPLRNGERLRIVKKDQKIALLQREWMSANHRMAMGIPLHPDRMSSDDWTALPGIGVGLAERIEVDRQKNGECGSFDALLRVKGIGKKRLDSWKEFFNVM